MEAGKVGRWKLKAESSKLKAQSKRGWKRILIAEGAMSGQRFLNWEVGMGNDEGGS
jgi:hypothetical protein